MRRKKEHIILLLIILLLIPMLGIRISAEGNNSEGVVFRYYSREDFVSDMNNGYKVVAEDLNVMKFSIDCLDSNGNSVNLPEGSYIPSYIYGPTSSDIKVSLFSDISIPGFTFDNGIAFFYWYGTFNSTKFTVTNITNLGRISDNYPNYKSYLGFLTVENVGHDYKKNDGFYAYNPTGYLQVVYNEVSQSNPFKTVYFVNGSSEVVQTQVEWDGNSFHYYPSKIEDPVKEGYTFTGWYLDNDLTQKVDDSYFETETDRDVYLYAGFEKTKLKFNVTFIDNDGNVLDEQIVTEGDDAISPDNIPEISGYDFAGWDTDIRNVNSNLTAKTVYKAHQYSITYDLSDGTNNEENPDTYTIEDETIVLKDPSRTGYNFIKWLDSDTIEQGSTGDKEFSAVWEAKKYKVRFVDEDGNMLSLATYPYSTPAADIELPAKPSKAKTAQYSYEFANWEPKLQDVEGDITYQATFTASVNEYELFADSSEGGTTEGSGTYEYGETVTIKAIPDEGQHFVEWADGNTDPEREVKVTGSAAYKAIFEKNIYQISWTNEDGSLLKTDKVAYGDTPKYEGDIPEKASTAEYSYHFSGWDKELEPAHEDTTYIAVYSDNVNQYKIAVKASDARTGDTFGSGTYDYGSKVRISAAANYGYVFERWNDGSLEQNRDVTVSKDTTYTASFVPAKFTVTFLNEDGSILSQEEYDYLTDAQDLKIPADPDKQGDAQFSYEFIGWDQDISKVIKDQTYTARFKETVNKYAVRFINADGETLQESELEYGTIPEYLSDSPKLASNAKFDYKFIGWDKELAKVEAKQKYTAQYDAIIKKYNLMLNVNNAEYGTVEGSGEYDYGSSVALKAIPEYGYKFVKWSDGDERSERQIEITEDRTLEAVFEPMTFTVRFVDDDGTEILTADYEYLTKTDDIVIPEKPVKQKSDEKTFEFQSWSPALKDVTSDIVYVATYKSTVNKYAVTFVNENDEVLQESLLEYGTVPEFFGEIPLKEGDAEFTYSFSGWSPEISTVRGNSSYKTVFASQVNKYTVTFIYPDKETTVEVEYGKTVAEPEHEERNGYTFIGWTDGENMHDFDSKIVSDLILTPVWEKKTFNIDYELNGGVNDLDNPKAISIEDSVVLQAPTRQDYSFTGWTLDETPVEKLENIDKDIVLTANWIHDGLYKNVTDPDSNFYSANIVEDCENAIKENSDSNTIKHGLDINYYLNVIGMDESEVAPEDRQLIENVLKKDYEIAQYIDITLWKQIMDGVSQPIMISETEEKIVISFKIDDDLLDVNKDYVMMVNHEGEVMELESIYDPETQTLTFSTNKFSTYSIAIRKEKEKGNVVEKIITNTITVFREVVGSKFKQPKTGVEAVAQTSIAPTGKINYKFVCASIGVLLGSIIGAKKLIKKLFH